MLKAESGESNIPEFATSLPILYKLWESKIRSVFKWTLWLLPRFMTTQRSLCTVSTDWEKIQESQRLLFFLAIFEDEFLRGLCGWICCEECLITVAARLGFQDLILWVSWYWFLPLMSKWRSLFLLKYVKFKIHCSVYIS